MKVAITEIWPGNIYWSARAELIEMLKSEGHTVCCVGQPFEGETHPYFAKNGVEFLTMPLQRTNTNPFYELRAIRDTQRTLETNNIEAIIAYGIRSFPTIVIAAKLAGVKKILCIVNGAGRLFYLTGPKGLLVKFISYPMLWLAFSLCNNILFQNPDDIQLIRSKGLLWKNNYGMINGSGVDLIQFKANDLNPEPVFTMIGRLTGAKGVNEYIQAAQQVKSQFPEAEFYLVGSMDNDDGSIDLIELDKAVDGGIVKLNGRVEDVRPYISLCRVFVLPSYREGTPRTVIEAMAMGRPIITTDAPGCRETVIDGVNGFKVPVRDAQALAEKMIWMIQNRDKVEDMGLASRRICEDKYDVHAINKTILNTIGL